VRGAGYIDIARGCACVVWQSSDAAAGGHGSVWCCAMWPLAVWECGTAGSSRANNIIVGHLSAALSTTAISWSCLVVSCQSQRSLSSTLTALLFLLYHSHSHLTPEQHSMHNRLFPPFLSDTAAQCPLSHGG